MALDSRNPHAASIGGGSNSSVSNRDGSTVESPATTAPRLWMADLALFSVAVIWGVNIPVMKVALETGISPYALNAVRLVVSAAVLQGFAWAEYRRGIRPTSKLQWWRVVTYALMVSVAYQLLFLLAVSKTTSANVALIMATVPMWTALAARFFLKEILPPLAWLGLITAFSGTMIVTLQKQLPTETSTAKTESAMVDPVVLADNPESVLDAMASSSSTTFDDRSSSSMAAVAAKPAGATTLDPATRFIGNMIALVAALAWAGGTVFSRPLLKTISPTQLSAFSATFGLPFHILLAGSTLTAALPLLKQVPLVLCIFYSGILSTGLALAMWSYGVKHAGAAQASMYQNLSPIVAIAAAWIWRGEPLTVPQAIGGAMIIGGLIIMRKSRTQVTG